MDRYQNNEKPYKDHHHHHRPSSLPSSSPRKKPQASKRDEWSEGAVATLLEAYESKWVLRNRAKLKGQDWEDVARQVSGRAGSARSAKTLAQCKNKIESMKKRYRSESAASSAAAGGAACSSSWPLYGRLDGLLRGSNSRADFGCGGKDDVAVVEVEAPSLDPVVFERPVEMNPGGADYGMGKENNTSDVVPKPANPEPESNVRAEETESINGGPIELQITARRRPKSKAKKTQRIKRRDDFRREIGESVRWL